MNRRGGVIESRRAKEGTSRSHRIRLNFSLEAFPNLKDLTRVIVQSTSSVDGIFCELCRLLAISVVMVCGEQGTYPAATSIVRGDGCLWNGWARRARGLRCRHSIG